MARLFDDASSEYLYYAFDVSFGSAYSMGAWFYCDDEAISGCIIAKGNSSINHFIKLVLTAGPSGVVRFNTVGTGVTSYADTTTNYSENTWHHALGVVASAADKRVYLDGGGKGTNTSDNPGTITSTSISIGALDQSGTYGQHFSGAVAEAAIWNVALTDDEAAMLGAGYSPLLVRPGNLLLYWPVVGRTSPEIELIGGRNMTLSGTPSASAHPDIFHAGAFQPSPFPGVAIPTPPAGPVYVPRAGVAVADIGGMISI